MVGDGITQSCSTPKPSRSWIMQFFPDDVLEFPSPIRRTDDFTEEVSCDVHSMRYLIFTSVVIKL